MQNISELSDCHVLWQKLGDCENKQIKKMANFATYCLI